MGLLGLLSGDGMGKGQPWYQRAGDAMGIGQTGQDIANRVNPSTVPATPTPAPASAGPQSNATMSNLTSSNAPQLAMLAHLFGGMQQ